MSRDCGCGDRPGSWAPAAPLTSPDATASFQSGAGAWRNTGPAAASTPTPWDGLHARLSRSPATITPRPRSRADNLRSPEAATGADLSATGGARNVRQAGICWRRLYVDAAIDDLSDVTITAAAAGDYLRHNGTAWVDSRSPSFLRTSRPLTAPAAASMPTSSTAIRRLSTPASRADEYTGDYCCRR